MDDRVRGLQMGGRLFDQAVRVFRVAGRGFRRVDSPFDPGATEATTLGVADLEMNLIKREVTRSGRRIDLTPREFALLEYLLRNAERVVSRTMIMEHVWDYNFDPMTNVVEARMCKLREKIDDNSDKKLIHTIRGFGYVIRDKLPRFWRLLAFRLTLWYGGVLATAALLCFLISYFVVVSAMRSPDRRRSAAPRLLTA